MGYINEFILSHYIRIFMDNLGIQEIIKTKHEVQGIWTTIPNRKGLAIDGIWESQGIIISQGVYLPFQDGPKSDHRLL